MTRTIAYSLVIVGCAVVGIIVAGPTASTSPQDRLETIATPEPQAAELPAPAAAPSTNETPATTNSSTTSSTTNSSTTAPAAADPPPTSAPPTTAHANLGAAAADEHAHADDTTDIDLAVLVVLAGTSDRYDTPAAARLSYLEEFATDDVIAIFGTLTDTQRTDRVVKMSTLTTEPTTHPGGEAALLVVDVTVDVTTFSATADRNTIRLDVTATVDTHTSRVVDVELVEV